MKKLILTLFLSLTVWTEAWAQNLTARVNRSEVPEGETILLTLDYDGSATNAVPDLNVLDKDFTIYSVSNSFRSNYVNGVTTQTRQWQIGLMPKASAPAEVEIPPVKLGNIASNPVKVRVLDAADVMEANTGKYQAHPGSTSAQARPKFAIKGAVDNETPYVQQQVDYTLTLYDTGGLQGSEPQFMDNGRNDWIIKSLGSPEIDSKVINGRAIREIKFHYALFPQKSGELETPEIRFNGYYLTQSRHGSDPFEELFGGGLFDAGIGFTDMFATRNPVVLTAKPVKVKVRPVPQNYNGRWWIPAESVRLYAEWEPKNPVFRVGEAINRTIYLKAAGVVDSQLPGITFKPVAGVKQYPEKAVTQNSIEGGSVVSVKKVSNVYIPGQPGGMTIPEVEVEWFNVRTGQAEKAVLPAVNITVLPGRTPTASPLPGTEASVPASEPSPAAAPVAKAENAAAPAAAPASVPSAAVAGGYYVYLIAAVAFVLGLLLSWLILRPKKTADRQADVGDYRKYVIRCAREKDFRALRDAILAWAADKYKDSRITNMKDVVARANSKEFEKQIELLVAELYSDNPAGWDSEKFIKTFESVDKKKTAGKRGKDPLPDLYK